ncbi:MAG: ABC transporter ATP-binding protein [Parachlamydiales bacterium]|nr:ABC transporter ATP-binding protein [Parachlamydiales bacterium]
MSDALVAISQLSKSFFHDQHVMAIEKINSMIPAGNIAGLVGPDGAGKTTLLRLIAGLLLPTEGSISVAGYDTIKQAEYVHFLTGYMPQKFGLYEDLTVIQNLNLYADLSGVVREERKKVFEKLFHFTNLEPFKNRLAGRLSGGMKQKLGLACVLIKKPELLLLDEPSVGVDPISRKELWDMIQDLSKEGISIIWSTANLEEAERCDTVLLLNAGKLLYEGKPADLTQKMKDRVFVITQVKEQRRRLLVQVLKQKNVLDGVIQGQDIRIVVRETAKEPIDMSLIHQQENSFQLQATKPRFEDAFMDILGGGPGGESALANIMPVASKEVEDLIVAEGLTKKFGFFTAASNITFSVHRGEIFGLLGPNGAGKSTTFKMLCGLMYPTEGKAYVKGVSLQIAPGKARSHIGYMAQKFSLYGQLTVQQNLNFFAGIYNLDGTHKAEAIQQMIEIFDLDQYLHHAADSLPLGYKQRLSLACATMHHPEILFLDEPTSGVDPITRREFWVHINGLVEKGVTIMITTHFMDEAEYCDRIVLVYRSKIIMTGTPDELKNDAKSESNTNPTLEDAFIKLIEEYDAKNPL